MDITAIPAFDIPLSTLLNLAVIGFELIDQQHTDLKIIVHARPLSFKGGVVRCRGGIMRINHERLFLRSHGIMIFSAHEIILSHSRLGWQQSEGHHRYELNEIY